MNSISMKPERFLLSIDLCTYNDFNLEIDVIHFKWMIFYYFVINRSNKSKKKTKKTTKRSINLAYLFLCA